jgi:hypothetical protein
MSPPKINQSFIKIFFLNPFQKKDLGQSLRRQYFSRVSSHHACNVERVRKMSAPPCGFRIPKDTLEESNPLTFDLVMCAQKNGRSNIKRVNEDEDSERSAMAAAASSSSRCCCWSARSALLQWRVSRLLHTYKDDVAHKLSLSAISPLLFLITSCF